MKALHTGMFCPCRRGYLSSWMYGFLAPSSSRSAHSGPDMGSVEVCCRPPAKSSSTPLLDWFELYYTYLVEIGRRTTDNFKLTASNPSGLARCGYTQ
jgi:hypothetical protein